MNTERDTGADLPKSATRQEVKREIVEFVKLVAWFLVLFIALKTYVIEGYEVQGPSMIPTLRDEERILVLKLPHIVSRWSIFGDYEAIDEGDVIVFRSPDGSGKRYVKRVIAKGPKGQGLNTAGAAKEGANEGDTVIVSVDRGSVYVNNKLIEEDYISESVREADESTDLERVLYPGTYYVMGDNRTVSKDSRSFGEIADERIIGRAVLRFWPLHKISLLR